jgi:hypothetical protein
VVGQAVAARQRSRPGPSARRGAHLPPQAAALLELQRSAGNRAVAGLLAAGKAATPLVATPLVATPLVAAAVQRCGPIPADQCPCHDGENADERAPAQPEPVQRTAEESAGGVTESVGTKPSRPTLTPRTGPPGLPGRRSATRPPSIPSGRRGAFSAQRHAISPPAPDWVTSERGNPHRGRAPPASDRGVDEGEPVRRHAVLAAPGNELEGHLDLITGAAMVGAPVLGLARRSGRQATVQRFSLNPLDWAKKIWDGIKSLGSAALGTARSLGDAALSKAASVGSGVASAVGSAISSALSAVAGAARSGVSALGGAARSALQTLGGLARRGLSTVSGVARSALSGALRLGRAAWDKATSVGRRALSVAMGAGRAALNAGKSLAARALGAVRSRVGGLWNGLKTKASALKNRVLAGAKGLLAKAVSLGGRAVSAAKGVVDKIGGEICGAIGRATSWVYDKVAPLVKKAWAWAKENPVKAIAILLIPGGPLLALGTVLAKKMFDLAKSLFAPVAKAIAAKAKAAWNTAKRWGATAFNTAKRWAGRAVSGATALGRKALGAAARFGRNVLGKAKDLGGRVIGKAREWGGKVLNTARDLGAKVWGKAKELGGKLLGLADSLTGGLASKIKGLADKMLGKAAGVLSWVMSKARSLADKALSTAKSLASSVLSKAKSVATAAWNKAKDLGATVAAKARDFASSALAKGKELLARAGRAAVDFGRRAAGAAKSFAGRAWAAAKRWGAKAWSTAKRWGGKAWDAAKKWGGKAWDWTKEKAGQAWDLAKSVAGKLAPYARTAWEWAKKIGKAIGVDKVVAAVKSLGKQALELAKKGLTFIKDKVLPIVEKLRQARNTVMSYTTAGMLCKAIGCAYHGVTPKAGKDAEMAADLATDIIPVVSTVKDTCTCLVGENFVTNEKVGAAEQGLACAFAAIDIVGYVGDIVTEGGATAGTVALRAAFRGGLKVGGEKLTREALELLLKKGGREFAERLGKEGMKELAERLGKEGIKELAEKMGKEEFEKFAKKAAEEGVKEFDEVAQTIAKEGAEQAGKEAADLATRKTADGASEIHVKENHTIEVCPIQRCPSLGETLGSATQTSEVAKHAGAAESAAKEGNAVKAADEGAEAVNAARKSSMPDWLRKRFEAGNKFDDEMAEIFDRNYRQLLEQNPSLAKDPEKLEEALRQQVRHEVGVTTDGKYYRLDTLLAKGPSGFPEIVSRKFTQISEIKPETAKGYVDELLRKYKPGSTINNPAKGTPSKIPDDAIQVMQIPAQKVDVSDPKLKEFLQYAKRKGVIVRDEAGKDLTALV